MTPALMAQERARSTFAHERALIGDVKNWLTRAFEAAARLIEKGQDAKAVRVPAGMEGDLAAYVVARSVAIGQIVEAQTQRQLGQLAAKRADESVTAYLRRYSVRRVTGIRKTTAKKIRAVITRGHAAGLSAEEIGAEMRKVTRSVYVQRRAEVIARTEIHFAAERAAFLTAKRSGLRTMKVWASMEDQRVRPAHAAANNQVRPLDEPFLVGGEELMHPGDPNGSPENIINCRCVCVFTLAPAALGLPRQWRPSRRPAMAEAV